MEEDRDERREIIEIKVIKMENNNYKQYIINILEDAYGGDIHYCARCGNKIYVDNDYYTGILEVTMAADNTAVFRQTFRLCNICKDKYDSLRREFFIYIRKRTENAIYIDKLGGEEDE
jgi:hypothetical protein